MMTEPYINTFQFMVDGVTGVASGKKEKMRKIDKKATAMPLINMPYLPRLQRAGGRGSPRCRLIIRQEKEMM